MDAPLACSVLFFNRIDALSSSAAYPRPGVIASAKLVCIMIAHLVIIAARARGVAYDIMA